MNVLINTSSRTEPKLYNVRELLWKKCVVELG